MTAMRPLDGVYRQDAAAGYVARRARILGGEWTPPPIEGFASPRCNARDEDALARLLGVMLAADGLAAVTLGDPLESAALVRVAERLGRPVPERSPEVQAFVEHGVVLNLRPAFDETAEVERQPFATNFISLHTEGSMAPPDRRPALLLFQCRETDADASGGKTVVLSMADVVARLPFELAAILRRTGYRGRAASDPILAEIGGSFRLTFRDFMYTPLEWTCWASRPNVDATDVNHALRTLHEALYAAPLHHVPYTAGTLFVLDNRRFLHGRTRIMYPDSRRHLQRVRIAVPNAAVSA
jgi:hypothetical protein